MILRSDGKGAGQSRFKDAPVKNAHSHIGDAFGYLLLGGGEHRRMIRSGHRNFANVQQTATMDFNVFD